MSSSTPRSENLLLNLALNLVAPVLFLKKAPQWFGLDPLPVLVIALLFPTAYFCYDLWLRKKANPISILGFVSVFLTGSVGAFHLPRLWFLIKEAALPVLIGAAVVLTQKTRSPLVKTFLFNESVFDIPRIEAVLKERQREAEFTALLSRCTWMIAGSFLLSGAIQWGLAAHIVTVEPADNPALFNEQVSDVVWISHLVVMIPALAITGVALWQLVKGLERLTALPFEQLTAPTIRQSANESSK